MGNILSSKLIRYRSLVIVYRLSLYDEGMEQYLCVFMLRCRPVTGRFVSFYKEVMHGLIICEFEVYGESIHQYNGNKHSCFFIILV